MTCGTYLVRFVGESETRVGTYDPEQFPPWSRAWPWTFVADDRAYGDEEVVVLYQLTQKEDL